MPRREIANPIAAVAIPMCVGSAVLTAGVLRSFPGASYHTLIFWVLALMALLAEFVPVELSRRGVRITFTLPYIAAMAVAISPSGALLTDLGVTLVAGILYPIARKQAAPAIWLTLNAAVAALGVCAGIAAMSVVPLIASTGVHHLQAIAFMLGYGVTNLLLVATIDYAIDKRPLRDNILASLSLGLSAIALYVVLALTVTVFAAEHLPIFIPVTLVPVWALRTGLEYQARMYEHYYETISALSLMLQRAHPYTHGHLERVAMTAEEVARRLGLSDDRARLVREAAVLHDIGKIAVSEEILDKPAKLTDEEMDHVRRHASMGAQILSPVKGFHEMVPWIRHHHERPDGKGYPDRLTDVEIPIESKIIAVVDAYDAMTGGDEPGEKRSYRDSMTAAEALAELERCAGTQFDTRVVYAFKEVILGGSI